MNSFIYIIVFLCTFYAVYSILRLCGVLTPSTGNTEVKKGNKVKKKSRRIASIENFKLDFLGGLTNTFSFLFSEELQKRHQYYIARLEIKNKKLSRLLTPEELRGKYIFILLIGILFVPLGFLKQILFIVPAVCVVVFLAYQRYYMTKINDEDAEIDNYFTNIFLMLYAELMKGSRGSIRTVVLSYQNSLKSYGNSRMSTIMLKFTKFLLSNLDSFSDDVAVMKLRDRYMSATIVNFTNLASQALQGVNNQDTLLSYRLTLVRKKTDTMKLKSEKMIRRGQLAICVVYGILFQYILLSFIAKLPAKSILPF